MKQNNILINDLELLDAGFLLACEAAACTYGAEGRLSLLELGDDKYYLSKDGLNTMRHVNPSNKIMKYGALHATAGATNTVMRTQDSSTGTAILMKAFLENLDRKEFNKKVEKGIKEGVQEVYTKLNELSKPATKEDFVNIARVSLNNDEELADIVISAFDYAGEEGIVEYVVKRDKAETEFIPQNGMFLDKHGFANEYFVNREDTKVRFEGENVGVICSASWSYEQKIINEVQRFYLDGNKKKPLVLFLERPNAEMTEKLIGIKQVGFNVCVVACNGYSEIESENLLKDIANFTGASVYNPRVPESEVVFGLADKIVSTIENTSILVEDVPEIHKETLERLKTVTPRDEKRIRRLTNKAAIIEIGGMSETAILEEKDRIDDCIGSIKTTKAEGTISGGGSTLAYISGQMNKVFENKEVQKGYDLVKKVIKQPMLRLLKNANRESVEEGSELSNEFTVDYLKPALENYGVGYNVVTDEIENLIDSGIIDSKKSIKTSLESAVERSIQMFNIAVIALFPDKREL